MRIALLLVTLALPAAAADAFVPFVIPTDMSPDSMIALDYAPLTEADRLAAKEHFVSSKGRVKLWGVNLSFGANFPTHADAPRVARRLAQAGVNTVRFHHMDSANWPRGIWDETGRALHPEALDRLDYFIDQLAARGIYSNLNLHVGKEHSRDLGLPPSPDGMDKMIAIFAPQLVERQKQYARDLLGHVNPYRQMRYADDWAVGIVEITNENSLFMWSAPRVLPGLPEPYAGILQTQYNAWLKAKYGDTAALEKKWAQGGEPLGENLLANSDFAAFEAGASAPRAWTFQQIDSAKGKLSTASMDGRNALLIKPEQIDGSGWHLQLFQHGLKVEEGKLYTLRFEARAQKSREVAVSVMQDHAEWANLGLSESIRPGSEWKTYQLVFRANRSDTGARVNFALGMEDTPFSLANVTLRPGAAFELGKGETLEDGTVKVFGESESEARRIDRMIFLAETEKAYFDGMRKYIKNDLGYKGLVTGTIVFGPLGLWAQSDMDFIDSHAYWQHPRFPNQPWDAGDWLIEQKAMSAHPEESTLLRLAAERLHGKPFTVTEYNHPAPLDSQAECVPMIASFAASQDWDGVWLYTYSHTQDSWDRTHLNSYFDIDTNPAKWAFMPAGARVFRHTEIYPLSSARFVGLKNHFAGYDLLHDLAGHHIQYGSNMTGFFRDYSSLGYQSGVYFGTGFKAIDSDHSLLTHTDLTWNEEEGVYLAEGYSTVICTGAAERFEIVTKGKIQVASPGFAAVTVTPFKREAKLPLRQPVKYLITACGRVENEGMQFSEDRQTVGRNWGQGPVQIEPVEGTIKLSLNKDQKWVCHALNPDGSSKGTKKVENGIVHLDPASETMWYLVEPSTDEG